MIDTFSGDSVRHLCMWQGRPEAESHGCHKLVFTMRKAEQGDRAAQMR